MPPSIAPPAKGLCLTGLKKNFCLTRASVPGVHTLTGRINMKKLDRLSFSEVYYWLGRLKGELKAGGDRELLKDMEALEKALDEAMGYEN